MSTIPQFRDLLPGLLPKWASNRPGFQVYYKVLYAFASLLDTGTQALLESIFAPFPGIGTPTALPLIGAARGLLRGEADTDTTYAGYLQTWRTVWDGIASDEALALQIQRYFANHPVVRIVNRAGIWLTLNADGSFTVAGTAASPIPLNWDTISNPERNDPASPWWSDIWIVIYAPEWPVRAPLSDGPWNSADLGLGIAIPRVARDVLSGFISGPAQWKAPHCWVQAVLFVYDTTLLDPANLSLPGNPDGHWGKWSKIDGSGDSVPARNATGAIRYMLPENG